MSENTRSKRSILIGGAMLITQTEASSLRPGIRPRSRNGKKIVTPGMRPPTGKRAAGGKKNKHLKTVGTVISDLWHEYDVRYEGVMNPTPPNHQARAIDIKGIFPVLEAVHTHG